MPEVFPCRTCGQMIGKDDDYVVIRKTKELEIRAHAKCIENATKK